MRKTTTTLMMLTNKSTTVGMMPARMYFLDIYLQQCGMYTMWNALNRFAATANIYT